MRFVRIMRGSWMTCARDSVTCSGSAVVLKRESDLLRRARSAHAKQMSAAQLREYNIDWHAVRDHELRPRPLVVPFQKMSMDERWARPSPDELAERSIAIWEEGFALVVEDLLALPDSRTIVAEGPGAFPWCVAPVVSSPRQAIFFVPTPKRREVVASRRWGSGQRERFPGIVERERALTNIRARDVLLDARIVSSCAELGLRCERMDGSLDLDASLALVEDHFHEHLPATPNV